MSKLKQMTVQLRRWQSELETDKNGLAFMAVNRVFCLELRIINELNK